MPKLWQRQAANPRNLETLWLLDCAWHLVFIAYRDTELREQLSDAWAWCLTVKGKSRKPSGMLALRSSTNADRVATDAVLEEADRHVAPRPEGTA